MKRKILKLAAFALLVLAVCPALAAGVGDDPKLPKTYNFMRAMEEFDKENYPEARDYLQKDIKENPKNGYAYYWLAVIDKIDMDYGHALANCNMALYFLPKKDKAYVAYAHKVKAAVYMCMDETDQALAEYGAAIKTTPYDVDLWNERGDIYYGRGDYSLAESDYERIVALEPYNPVGYIGLGRNLRALGKYEEAIPQLDYAIKLNTKHSIAYALRAECYLESGDWNRATDDLISALDIEPNAYAYNMMRGLTGEAFDTFLAKLKIQSAKEPNKSIWMYYAGTIHENHGEYRQAAEYFSEAMEKDPSPVTANQIADCYGKLGDFAEGLAWIDKALDMDPENGTLSLTKANLLYETGDVAGAIETIGGYIQKYPDFYGGYYRRGFYKDNARMTDEAIEDYTYSIALDPDYAYAYFGRGDMYRDKGDTLRATADYKKVVELDTIPGNASCAQYALLELGKKDEATAFMDSIISRDREYAGNYYDAACLYSRMGEKDKAMDFLRLSLEKGYRRFAHMMIDDDLAAIRDTDAFKALMEEYQAIQAGESHKEEEDSLVEEVVSIPFTKEGNLFKVKCTINDLPLHLIFDTGASSVTLSMVEANFMFKTDYLTATDVVGSQHFRDANGDISEGTVINLSHVNLAGLELPNVRAGVVRNQRAPLLLGQSVLSRLGKIEIDNESQQLKITHKVKK